MGNSLVRLNKISKHGRARLFGAVMTMNHSAKNELGVEPDKVPHHDATPNHARHLEAVLAEAKAKRERKGHK